MLRRPVSFGKAAPSAAAPPGRRRAPRSAVSREGRLKLVAGTETCRCDDLSLTGARIFLTRHTPQRGDVVILILGNLEMFATVAWRQGQSCGLAFDEPLSPEVLVRLRG